MLICKGAQPLQKSSPRTQKHIQRSSRRMYRCGYTRKKSQLRRIPHTTTRQSAPNRKSSPQSSTPTTKTSNTCQRSSCRSAQGSGGTPPYTYSMDFQNWQTSPTFSGLAYGWYDFWVKDANGCVSGLPWPWDGCLDVQADWGYYTCGNSGSMVITAFDNSSYTGPFEYSLDGVNWQSSGTFTGLSPGWSRWK